MNGTQMFIKDDTKRIFFFFNCIEIAKIERSPLTVALPNIGALCCKLFYKVSKIFLNFSIIDFS